MNSPVDFTSATNFAPLCCAEMSRASITPTLSAKISSPSLSTTPQRSPSPSKPSATSAFTRSTSSRMACSIFMSSVLGLYFGKVWSSSQSSGTTSQPTASSTCGANAPAVPLPQAQTTLRLALELGTVGEVGDVAGGEILDKRIRAAATHVEAGFEHDFLEPGHLIRAEGERAIGPHLHAGPAVVVVRRRHHGHAGHVEVELGEIGHGRDRKADVVDLAARRQQAGYQRGLHRRRIATKIVAGDDLGLARRVRG